MPRRAGAGGDAGGQAPREFDVGRHLRSLRRLAGIERSSNAADVRTRRPELLLPRLELLLPRAVPSARCPALQPTAALQLRSLCPRPLPRPAADPHPPALQPTTSPCVADWCPDCVRSTQAVRDAVAAAGAQLLELDVGAPTGACQALHPPHQPAYQPYLTPSLHLTPGSARRWNSEGCRVPWVAAAGT